ncbi:MULTISPECIES: hypothetical protein [Metabacillus]|uniref:hypothetical protein n=1 Tax=Metabacillus TaxID=2675233 RepID=UPI000C80EA08|nr:MULTISPECIES: hypothetical protein [Metabacillus]MCM3443971.1 hypothetical protein [Metabacillus halosaccharovorans]PMC34974.1 hypothetical protein CJ195_20930 [Bacillus sp. UMB0899]
MEFSNVAIECAERAKSDETFGSHLLKTIKRELNLKVIQPREIYSKYSNINDDLRKAKLDDFYLRTDDFSRVRAAGKLYDAMDNNNWIYLHGNLSTGKSFLASAACNYYLEQDKSALYIYTPATVSL